MGSSLPELHEPKAMDCIPVPFEDFHIYLFIGQSNMAGRAPIEDQDKSVLERVYLFNKEDQWEPAQPWILPESTKKEMQGLNRYSTVEVLNKVNGVSPAFYFAKNITVNRPGIAIGVVSNAKGGTVISEWLKGNNLYNEAVRRASAAMRYGVLKGIIWQQGESNRHDFDYVDVLAGLIADLRKDLGSKVLPFIAGEIPCVGDADKVQASADFNRRLSVLPERAPFTAIVSASGLQDIGDGLHINTAGQRLFGRRFAETALQMIYHMDVSPQTHQSQACFCRYQVC